MVSSPVQSDTGQQGGAVRLDCVMESTLTFSSQRCWRWVAHSARGFAWSALQALRGSGRVAAAEEVVGVGGGGRPTFFLVGGVREGCFLRFREGSGADAAEPTLMGAL